MAGDGVARVIKGGFWLYASMLVNNISGFIYWLIISKIAGSTILGLTSATIGLASLVNGMANLGLGVGLQHFLGQCLGRSDKVCFTRFFWTATYFTLLVHICVANPLILAGVLGYSFLGFSPAMLLYAGVIVILGSAMPIQASLIAMLRTDIVFLSSTIGNFLKILVGITLIQLGWGFGGAVVGYMLVSITVSILGMLCILGYADLTLVFDSKVLREILRGSIVSWLPGIIVLAGQWIGVLAVYGSSGAIETGYYYVAFVLASSVLGIGISMLNLLLPVLSGLSDGRKSATNKVLRISFVIIVPIAIYFIVYPWLPLSLLGREYMGASTILAILLLSCVPLALYATVNSLVYSYKKYREVLYLGLSQNVPRLILYLLLVPLFSGLGAAYSFTIGTYTGFLYAVYLAYRIGFRIDWALISRIIALPSILGLFAYMFHLNWLVALLIMSSSYLLYGKIGVLHRSDIREIAYALLGKKANEIYDKLGGLIDFFFS